MMCKSHHPVLTALAALFACIGAAMLACQNPVTLPGSDDCPAENPSASINVAGVFRYSSESFFALRGTITFEQQGNQVRVTDTTYDNASDRALQSALTPLQGNKLVAVLTPTNGDTNYTADVTFLFNEAGDRFCVEFSDTNGDTGAMGSYTGFKQ